MARDGMQERQSHPRIFQHVAMAGQIEMLVPIPGARELVMRIARIHPGLAVRIVVIGERKVRRPVTERLADGDTFRIESVRDAADGRLRPFLVDIPTIEMLDGAGIHDDERRMDDAAGIHQRAGQGIAARFDRLRKSPADHIERVRRPAERKHARGQAHAAAGYPHLIGALFAGKPGQRARLGEGGRCVVAGVPRRFREEVGSECSRRQIDDLTVAQMRRKLLCDIGLREGRRRNEDQLGFANRRSDVAGDQRQRGLPASPGVDDDDFAARPAMCFGVALVASPQPDIVAGKREIARRRKGAIAATKNRDLHQDLRKSGKARSRQVRGVLLHSAHLGRVSWNRSVWRAYHPLPCMRATRSSDGVSM